MSDVDDDSDGSKAGFVWTKEKVRITIWTSATPSIAGIVASLVVIGLAYTLYIRRRLRYVLRRHSFIMLLAVLVASLFESAAYLVELLLTGPTSWCSAALTFGFLTSNFVDLVIMCMALNLQLVFVHRWDTQGWIKYYLGISFVASLAAALAGAIRKIWGWDPITSGCYMTLSDPQQRLVWQIATGYFWQLFSGFVTLVCTLVVLGALVFHSWQRRREFTHTQISNTEYNRIARAIAWRITIYPCISIMVACIAAVSDFGVDEAKGIDSYSSFILWNIYGSFYGSQPLLLSIVAIFIDPSFSAGVRYMIFGDRDVRGQSTHLSFIQRRRLLDQRRQAEVSELPPDGNSDTVHVKTEVAMSHPEPTSAYMEFTVPPWDTLDDHEKIMTGFALRGTLVQM